MNQKTIELITRTAVQTAMEYLNKEVKEQKKEKRDRRLRNTKLLLKHYRSFKDHCEDVKMELEQLDDREFLDELDSDEFAVQAIKRSKERTLAMIHFIDRMLEVYRISSDRSNNPIQFRQYQTIYELYISKEEITIEQLAEKHDIDNRTVYRDINESVKTLSALFFGVDGVRMVV